MQQLTYQEINALADRLVERRLATEQPLLLTRTQWRDVLRLLTLDSLTVVRPTELAALRKLAYGERPVLISAADKFKAQLLSGQLIICQGRCGQAKEPSGFFRDPRKRNGRYSMCKECWRAYDRERKRALRHATYDSAA